MTTARSWALRRALAMSAARCDGVHHPRGDLDPPDTGKDSHLALDIGAQLVPKRAGGDCEGDLYVTRPASRTMSRTMPSSTMSVPSSGSMTPASGGPDALDRRRHASD